MKKIFYLVLFIIFIPNLLAGQDAPTGFGGLQWGDDISKFKELKDPTPFTLTDESEGKRVGIRYYKIGGIESIDISPTTYCFYKDRFCMAWINFKKDRIFKILKESLLSKYGQMTKETPIVLKTNPDVQVGIEYQWQLELKVWIVLKWDDLKKEGSLKYAYLPILAEQIKKEKEAEMESIDKTKNSL